jgi:hypothetical protein
MKVCLAEDVIDGRVVFRSGMIGRLVFGIHSHRWLAEFKIPDYFRVTRFTYAYVEVEERSFSRIW